MCALLTCFKGNTTQKRSKLWRPRIESMEPRALLSAVNWSGGGGDNNWDTPANWSTHAVPGAGDDVTIDVSSAVVHSNAIADFVHSLVSTQPLTISGGTLSIAAASTINSTLSINGGTLTGAGDVSVSGLVTLTGGTLSGSSASQCEWRDSDQPGRQLGRRILLCRRSHDQQRRRPDRDVGRRLQQHPSVQRFRFQQPGHISR